MLQITSYTPSWLSHPAPGARIFSDPEQKTPPSPSKRKTAAQSTTTSSPLRPRRLVAHRGSEVFAVVGNKIRWSDLANVKNSWEATSQSQQHAQQPYRTLTTSIYYEITSISISPSGHFLAIATEHAVWIASLPDAARLQEKDNTGIKLKASQIGRTTHVIGEASLASVLWHPFAASSTSSDCLVTVTVDAAVRLWDFRRTDSLSFDRPALALDLERLASATSTSNDIEPKPFGRSRGFSVDAFDFEVAAACFGGRGLEHEDPWASMTLWVAMTNSDVYALCPLLPQHWQPTTTTVPALTTTTMAEVVNLKEDDDVDYRTAAQQRYAWIRELDEAGSVDESHDRPIFTRPTKPSDVPRLQGPFEAINTDETDLDEAEICDIHVIPANMDEDELFSGEDDYEILGSAKSLPFTIVCLTTSSNQLHLMLELDGVTAQWLPEGKQHSFSATLGSAGEYVLLASIALGPDTLDASSQISIDATRPYVFYITTSTHTHAISLEEWAARVGSEVSDDIADGLESRLRLACQGPPCSMQEILAFPDDSSDLAPLSTAIVVQAPSLGSLILSTSSGRAVAAQLGSISSPESLLHHVNDSSPLRQSAFRTSQSLIKVLQDDSNREALPTRAPYAPSQAFYTDQHTTLSLIKSRIPAHKMGMLTETPLRLSPACLDVVTVAHRAFSQQTSSIEKAAAELFRRCLRLQEELVEQVKAMADLAVRVKELNTDFDEHPSDDGSHQPATPRERIEAAKVKQQNLVKRYEAIRRKAGQGQQRNQPLSISERTWIDDITSLADRVGDATGESAADNLSSLSARTQKAESLQSELMVVARSIKSNTASNRDTEQSSRSSSTSRPVKTGATFGISRFQKEKIQEVMSMVDRESAIIEAVEARLSKLKFNG